MHLNCDASWDLKKPRRFMLGVLIDGLPATLDSNMKNVVFLRAYHLYSGPPLNAEYVAGHSFAFNTITLRSQR
jgi:hypothetical protein